MKFRSGEMMKRADILATAAEYVTKDRAATHGSAEDNFRRLADLWAAYLNVGAITATDVAVMLALLKVARIRENPGHEDNWVDLAGYAACGGEIATGEKEGVGGMAIATEEKEGVGVWHR